MITITMLAYFAPVTQWFGKPRLTMESTGGQSVSVTAIIVDIQSA